MPKFQITQVRSTVPANVLPFQNSQTQDGSSQIGKSLSDFGNLISQIADKSIQAEQSQIVNNANTITQLDLAAVSSDRDIKAMSITGAVAEYKKRTKDIYDNAISTMSPASKRMFDKSWAANSTRSFIKFQSDAVKRNNSKIEANYFTGENNALRLGMQNGFDSKTLATVIESQENLVLNQIWTPDKAAQASIKFTQKWSKEAITAYINNGTADTLAEQYRVLNNGGKELPPLLNAYWKQMDPSDQRSMVSKVLSDLNHQLGLENKATRASEKKADDNAERLFGTMKTNIEMASTGDPTAQKEVANYTRDFLQKLIKTGQLKGKDAGALATLLATPDVPKVNVQAVTDLVNKVYAIPDLEEQFQKEEIKKIRAELNVLVSNDQANVGNITTINGLIDKIEQREFKDSSLYKGRKYLMRVLNVGEKAIISQLADKPGERRRAEDALREFDRRMSVVGDNGLPKADPMTVAEELIQRANIKPRALTDFVKPRFIPDALSGKRLEDFTPADVALSRTELEIQLRENKISKSEYLHQLRNLRDIDLAIPDPKGTDQTETQQEKKDRLKKERKN